MNVITELPPERGNGASDGGVRSIFFPVLLVFFCFSPPADPPYRHPQFHFDLTANPVALTDTEVSGFRRGAWRRAPGAVVTPFHPGLPRRRNLSL